MCKLLSILLVLLMALGLPAADLKLPANVRGDPGTFVQVQASTSGATVRWYVLDPGLNLFPVNLLKDTKTAVVTGTAPGAYRLLAYTSDKDGPSDPAVCTVTIGPPGPGPGPGPVPPQPAPTDPFIQAVQAAYTSCPDTAKATRVKDLAALWRQACRPPKTLDGNDPGGPVYTLPDTTTLLANLQAAVSNLLPASALPNVRQAVRVELNKTLTSPVTLDATTRPQVAALFSRVAAALESVK